MTVRSLFLLPGDGIGPEAMAEVRKLIDYMNSEKNAGFTVEEGLVGGSAYDAHGVAISDADMEKALPPMPFCLVPLVDRSGMACRMTFARSRSSSSAQGSRAFRKSASCHLLPGARFCLVAKAGAGRRSRYSHRSRVDRWRLFRRAEADHRSR